MTDAEYAALPPQTKYQIEKERRAERVDAMTKAQLESARGILNENRDPHRQYGKGRPRKSK